MMEEQLVVDHLLMVQEVVEELPQQDQLVVDQVVDQVEMV